MHTRTAWSEEQIETLRSLWLAGATTVEIASVIPPRTPCAIHAKARAIGLKSVPSAEYCSFPVAAKRLGWDQDLVEAACNHAGVVAQKVLGVDGTRARKKRIVHFPSVRAAVEQWVSFETRFAALRRAKLRVQTRYIPCMIPYPKPKMRSEEWDAYFVELGLPYVPVSVAARQLKWSIQAVLDAAGDEVKTYPKVAGTKWLSQHTLRRLRRLQDVK